MQKTMKLGEIAGLGSFLMSVEDIFEGMKLEAKPIYNILKLKKVILEKFNTGQEATMALAKSFDAVPVNGTSLQVPPERLEDFNAAYAELMSEEVTIDYAEIEISGKANSNPKFMEAFLDFITLID